MVHTRRPRSITKMVSASFVFGGFGLFVLKVGLLHLDSIYPMLQSELEVSSVVTKFGMLAMIFFTFIRK